MREKRIEDAIARVETVAAAGLSLTVRGGSEQSGPEPYTALTALLVEVGRAAMRHERVALVHIDEVQNITDERTLSQLLIALGDAITHEEEVAVPGGARVRRSCRSPCTSPACRTSRTGPAPTRARPSRGASAPRS
ncbi:hypothetical protein [Clavibacter zhangzhiyongii]|uniref:hypothetical protein n=1 Tax=Clavibacter zhangzhiyongii TaxID=2768071 RepID=UPI0039E1D4FF